jgi:hypothetical protein
VHEDRQLAAWVGDVWPPWRAFPVQSVAAQAGIAKRAPQSQFGTGVSGAIRPHHIPDGRA